MSAPVCENVMDTLQLHTLIDAVLSLYRLEDLHTHIHYSLHVMQKPV